MTYRIDSCHHVLAFCLAAGLITGCGQAGLPVGANGIIQAAPSAVGLAHQKSEMLPEVVNGSLLYVSSGSGVSFFSYPRGKMLGSLTGLQGPFGMCADVQGHVYVVDGTAQTIVEYNHGDTTPIRKLNDPNAPFSCTVDPKNGNLAVCGGIGHGLGTGANVAVFRHAKGTPKVHISEYFDTFAFCAYDATGDLFATGGQSGAGVLAELVAGSATFVYIMVDKPFGNFADVQWVGNVLVLADPVGVYTGPATFYKVRVSGSTGTVVKTFQLSSGSGTKNIHADGVGFWVHSGTIIYGKARFFNGEFGIDNAGLWKYPAGGNVERTLKVGVPLTVMLAQPPPRPAAGAHRS